MKPGVQAVFLTRYSFFGSSGWRAAASKDKERLLDPDRLDKRFELFQQMNLASLAAQSDPNFKLVILTSSDMPEKQAKDLTEACKDTLGDHRVSLLFRAPGSAGQWFQKFISRRLTDASHTLQIVLDDDDAVSTDFVDVVRREGEFAVSTLTPDMPHQYISFPNGLTAKFHDDTNDVDLMLRDVPFTNLGLTLVAPTDTQKSPFMLAHKKVARRHKVRVIHDQRPYYIRAVHDTNDSRAHHNDAYLDEAAAEKMFAYFPLLRGLNLRAFGGVPALTNTVEKPAVA